HHALINKNINERKKRLLIIHFSSYHHFGLEAAS
ncbi:hypothetical protein ALC56_11987, partial [Trachymyrmex septentrionalis]